MKLKLAVLGIVTLAALLPKLPLAVPAARGFLGPIGSHEFFCPLVLYSSPFLFLAYCLGTPSARLKFGLFECLYAAIVLMNTVSYFLANRGFLPVNPLLTEISSFFLFLLVRNLYSRRSGQETLFVLAVPMIPVAAEALHGLLQAVQEGLPARGAFLNYNFLGMLLAMTVLLAFSQVFPRKNRPAGRAAALLTTAIFSTVIILTTSRTAACGAVLALGTALFFYFMPLFRSIWQSWKSPVRTGMAVLTIALASLAGWQVYSIRPLSIWGRVSLSKVGLHIFSDNFLTGIGYGMIFPLLARYQERYFSLGIGSEIDRMLAGSTGMINSTYLARAVETGIFGLFLYLPFWFLILKAALILIKPEAAAGAAPATLLTRIRRGEENDMIRFGTGSVLLLFLVMSISYAPLDNLQISLCFSYILGLAIALAEDRPRMPQQGTRPEREPLK